MTIDEAKLDCRGKSLSLGAQAGEARLRDVAAQGGCSPFRRAAGTLFNLVF